MAGSLKSRESGPFTSPASFPLGGPSRLVSERDPLDEKFVSSRGSLASSTNPSESQSNTPWSLRLSLGQLVILWSIVAGTMLMVFLFGLYAGREQGVQAALEGSSGEAMRLPVANDINALKSEGSPLAALSDETSPPTSAGETAAPMAAPQDDTLGTAAKVSEVALAGMSAEKTSPQAAPAKAELSQEPAIVPKRDKPAKLPPVEAKKAANEISSDVAAEKPAEKILTKAEKNEAPKTIRAGALSPGWYLQVAAARTSKEATAIGRKLRAAGLSAIVESAEVKGAAYYRVVLGPYGSKDAAWSMRKSALATNAAKGEPFLKQVK